MDKSEFIISGLTGGQLNALVKNIMSQTGASTPDEAVRRINAGECVIKRWRKDIESGNIFLTIESKGYNGFSWAVTLQNEGFYLDDSVRKVFFSDDFKSHTIFMDGIVSKIIITKGWVHAEENHGRRIRTKNGWRNLTAPSIDAICSILDDAEDIMVNMGLSSIIVMHNPIKISSGEEINFNIIRHGPSFGIEACSDIIYYRSLRTDVGFAWLIS
ncbi:MAG: hypothetical protein WC863_00015 [Patescibacteria group bacterium]